MYGESLEGIDIEVKVTETINVENGGVVANGSDVTGYASVIARVVGFNIINV